MTFSEFGRRPEENGDAGTDHGAAGPMLLIGDRVRGGLHGTQPSLNDLDNNDDLRTHVDFRAVRFPGLISAATLPAGGTSDYASEMIHAVASGEAYACFVRSETRIPFMAMPDASAALLKLAAAPRERLRRTAYNAAAFSATAA